MIPRWLVRLTVVAVAMASVALGASVALWVDAREARSNQAHAICVSRNEERKVHRQNLDDQIEQTRGFSDQVFKSFGLDRQDAINRFVARRKKLHRLDCG